MNNMSQVFIVTRVLEEMRKTKESLIKNGASYHEEILYSPSSELHSETFKSDGKKSVTETFSEDDTSIVAFFDRIDWHGYNFFNEPIYFSFNNDGNIKFDRFAKIGKKTPKISYSTLFNVLSNDFEMSINYKELVLGKYIDSFYSFSLKNNIVIEKFNNIEIITNLRKKTKTMRIIKNNRNSIIFEVRLNSVSELELGAIAIDTHKGNGRVNGRYRYDVSKKKGIRANFYSRKGVRVNLVRNSELLDLTSKLLESSLEKENIEDRIILNFASAIENRIAKNPHSRFIQFANFKFDAKLFEDVHEKVISMVKSIKNSLLLPGLVERIEYCLRLLKDDIMLEKKNGGNVIKPKRQ